MKGKKENRRVLASRGMDGTATKGFLREQAAGPSFLAFVSRIQNAMKNYSSVVINSVGLVLGDVSVVFKILTSRLRKSSYYNRLKSDATQARNRRLGKITSSMDALDNVMGGDSLLMYAFAPGLAVSSRAFRIATFQDKQANEWIQDLNIDRLPIIGDTVTALTLRQESLWENTDFLTEDAAKAHYAFLMGFPNGNSPPPNSKGIVGKAWDLTQSLFLLDFSSESTSNRGPLLLEGAEKPSYDEMMSMSLEDLKAAAKEQTELAQYDYPSSIKSYDDYVGWFVGKLLDDNLGTGEEFLEEREEAMMPYFEKAAAAVGHYSVLTATDDLDEFMASLKAIAEFSDGKYDVDEAKAKLEAKVKEIADDEKVKSEYQKALKKAKEKVPEGGEKEHYQEWLLGAALMASKAQVLKSLKTVFVDFVDDLDDLVKEGISDEMLEMMQGKSEWKPLLDHFAKFDAMIEKQMAPILSKVENNS